MFENNEMFNTMMTITSKKLLKTFKIALKLNRYVYFYDIAVLGCSIVSE